MQQRATFLICCDAQAVEQFQGGDVDVAFGGAADQERIVDFAPVAAAIAFHVADHVARIAAAQRHERRQVAAAAMPGQDGAEVRRTPRSPSVGAGQCDGAASRWPPWKFLLERISVKRSLRAARRGNSSVKRTPGVRVAMVVNGPRYSAGAFGLGSKVSRWFGAPRAKEQDRLGPRASPPACLAIQGKRRQTPAQERPAADSLAMTVTKAADVEHGGGSWKEARKAKQQFLRQNTRRITVGNEI